MTMKRTILVLALLSVITGLTLPAIAEEQEAPPRLTPRDAGKAAAVSVVEEGPWAVSERSTPRFGSRRR